MPEQRRHIMDDIFFRSCWLRRSFAHVNPFIKDRAENSHYNEMDNVDITRTYTYICAGAYVRLTTLCWRCRITNKFPFQWWKQIFMCRCECIVYSHMWTLNMYICVLCAAGNVHKGHSQSQIQCEKEIMCFVWWRASSLAVDDNMLLCVYANRFSGGQSGADACICTMSPCRRSYVAQLATLIQKLLQSSFCSIWLCLAKTHCSNVLL